MRTVVLLTLALLMLGPLGSANEGGGRLVLTIISVDEEAVLLAWTPAVGATEYEVLRGPSPEKAVRLGIAPSTAFLDDSPHAGDVWYIVKSIQFRSGGGEDSSGSCVERQGTTGVAVTTSSCV